MMTVENRAFDSPVAMSDEAALRNAVGERTSQLCARDCAPNLRAVVLTGSVARDEGTWVRQAAGWELLGDAEFFLVFETGTALPPQPAVDSLTQKIEGCLRRDGILGHVHLAPVPLEYFTRLEPDIFAYELCTYGRVVWGEPDILSLIPPFTAADIPLEDAWRLLANRMVEQLEATARIKTFTESLPESLRYRTVKLYLDMATSLLLFVGSYAPAYRERQRRLRILADAGTDESWPFPLGPFAQQVSVSTDLKLGGEWGRNTEAEWEFWRHGLQYARLLWYWELARLVNARQAKSEDELMRRWMRRQPFVQRVRGWMFVWRACGWQRSWRWWPRWARLAAEGSPRYWVYSAAYGLFCQLPEVLEVSGEGTVPDALGEDILRRIPLVRRPQEAKSSQCWADLVGEVAWNYHRFLESTRA